jgi:hypothetical protein
VGAILDWAESSGAETLTQTNYVERLSAAFDSIVDLRDVNHRYGENFRRLLAITSTAGAEIEMEDDEAEDSSTDEEEQPTREGESAEDILGGLGAATAGGGRKRRLE